MGNPQVAAGEGEERSFNRKLLFYLVSECFQWNTWGKEISIRHLIFPVWDSELTCRRLLSRRGKEFQMEAGIVFGE